MEAGSLCCAESTFLAAFVNPMADFRLAYEWAMQFENPQGIYTPVPDKCPDGHKGPCFALSGISSAVWAITVTEISAAPEDQRPKMVENFYLENYWNKWFQQFNVQMLANSVFDMKINAGPSVAVHLLQRMLGVKQDGLLGPVTVTAVNRANPKNVVSDYAHARCLYYTGIDETPQDHESWTRRALATCA